MAVNCAQFNSYLFRRVPDWDKKLAKDRFPHSYTYTNLYSSSTWPAFTGTTHTWDKVHVTRPNDDGCWETVNADACVTNICDPTRLYTGWGSTRSTYTRFHRDYSTPVFCFDQLRNIEEAEAQLSAIIEGHKELPDEIISDFLRLYSLRSSNFIWICGSGLTSVAVSDSIFLKNCNQITLGSAANLPTSKLSMPYLNHYAPTLMYQGYMDKQMTPDTRFTIKTDLQSAQELCNANPALTQMYNAADFAKGGKFFEYGAMMGCGNYVFSIDKTPLRFQDMGGGVLQRIWPYQNISATVGKKPVFDPAYENAQYQLSHITNRATRQIFVGDITPVNPEMKFNTARSLMGKWSWKAPDAFQAVDPINGSVCTYYNDKQNKGYFLSEFELGVKTVYPEIEMFILHQREAAPVVDVPRCSAQNTTVYQTLTPYNSLCETA